LVKNSLPDVFSELKKQFKGRSYTISTIKEILNDLLKKNNELYHKLVDLINNEYNSFLKVEKGIKIKKNFTQFLYKSFNKIFEFTIHNFFGLNKESLKLHSKEIVSNDIVIFEYYYFLSPLEITLFKKASSNRLKKFDSKLILIGYLFFIVLNLGIKLKNLIKDDFLITLDCATFSINEQNDAKPCIYFMIFARRNINNILKYYLGMSLYYFLKQLKNVPHEYMEQLLEDREKLYEIALNEYSKIKEKLIDILYYFYRKCKILGNICPLLDFMNYVCSRVEDSIFSKIDIIKKEFLNNLNYTVEKKNSIIEIFNFLDRKSTLYSTFQANNLPSPKAQFNLFLLYVKYFVSSGLESLEISDLLFLPEIFSDILNEYNLDDNNFPLDSKSINNINKFISYLSLASNIDNFNVLIKKIFNKSINDLNSKFFRTFLNSFNIKLSLIIEKQNTILSENPKNKLLTFNLILDHICRILYVLIDKIFLRKNLEDASKNFIDPRGRYISKNIALRVLEILMFLEFNFSDDIWPEFLISLNKNKIIEDLSEYNIKIPEKYFYTDNQIIDLLSLFNYQPFNHEITLEEWLLKEIFKPLNDFIVNIRKKIRDPKNTIEIYEILSQELLEGEDDKDIIRELKYICQQFAPFWQSIE